MPESLSHSPLRIEHCGCSEGKQFPLTKMTQRNPTTRFLELSSGFNVAAWYPDGMVPLNGDLEFLLNDNGDPRDFLELNSDEREYNDSAIFSQIMLWPIGGTVYNETGYIFYNKVIYVNGDSIHIEGTGVAEVSPSGETSRLESNLYPDDPTLFWDKKEFGWGEVSVLENDTLFVYRRAPDYHTYLARVPAVSIGDISQYSYYIDWNHWSSISDDANSFNDYGYLSFDISPNEYLGRYIVILDSYDNVVMQKMWDPLSWPSIWYPMFDVQYSFRSVQLHPSLNQRGDRVVFVSYNTLWDYSDSMYRRSYTYFVAFNLELE